MADNEMHDTQGGPDAAEVVRRGIDFYLRARVEPGGGACEPAPYEQQDLPEEPQECLSLADDLLERGHLSQANHAYRTLLTTDLHTDACLGFAEVYRRHFCIDGASGADDEGESFTNTRFFEISELQLFWAQGLSQ